MKPNIGRRTATLFGTFAILMLALQVAAQQPPQLNTLLASMSANAKQLRKYTFEQRTETYVGGDLKNAQLDEVHCSICGERVSIPLNEQSAHSEPHRRGPGARLITKKIEEQKENMQDYTERLMALTAGISHLSPANCKPRWSMPKSPQAGAVIKCGLPFTTTKSLATG